MKKSQRSRFLALQAQSTRTAAEQTEFDSLKALAVANPDASKDTDDTAAVAKPNSVSDFMVKFTAAIRSKEALALANAEFQQRIKDLEAGQIGAVTLVAVITGLGLNASDLAGKDAAAIAAAIKAPAATDASAKDTQISTLTSERDTAREGYATIGKALGLKEGDLITSAENLTKYGVKDDEEFKKLSVAQRTARVVQAAFEHAISTRALAVVQELGFNAQHLPAPKDNEKTGSASQLQAEYDTLVAEGKSKEASAFWSANFAKMFPAANN